MLRAMTQIVLAFLLFAPSFLFSQEAVQPADPDDMKPADTWTLTTMADGNAVNVNWSTDTEVNSDYFVVQRSKYGEGFDDVMQELAAGNSETVNHYSITDYRPFSGISFYRVIEFDLDGRITQYGLTTANYEPELSMTVYPSQNIGALNVLIDSKTSKQVLLVVRDIQGREYYSKVILVRSADEIIAIEPEGNLAQGIYTVVASSNNAIFEKKIMITR